MTIEALQQAFDQELPELPGGAIGRKRRKTAFLEFTQQGLPSHRDEDWRYTRLTGVLDPELARRPPRHESFALPGGLDSVAKGPRVIFSGDGIVDYQAAAGLRISTLGRGGEPDSSGLLIPPPQAPALTTLNIARLGDGAIIDIADGFESSEPLYILFVESQQPGQAHQRLILNCGRGARANIVLHYFGSNSSKGWTNLVCDVSLQPEASLHLQRFQNHSNDHHHTERIQVKVSAGGQFQMTSADVGGRLVRNDVLIDLAAPGARADIRGVFFAGSDQHVDNHTRIDHSAPDTTSHELFRGIAGDGGRGVFNGKVVVHKDAQRIDAQQQSNNLLLGERCEIDTKPELEIYADDVKCSHGATVGQLDENQLYYLRTRGIDRLEAQRLLTLAFAQSVIEQFQLEDLRAQAEQQIIQRIGSSTSKD